MRRIKIRESKGEPITSLSEMSQALPRVSVGELVARLQELPQDQEIVIYPKYNAVGGYNSHRFRIGNVQERQQSDGYKYCAILF